MSFFDWLTTGSSHGILLEQEKEPALSKPFLPFLSSVSLQTQPFSHGYDLSKPLSKAQLSHIAALAHIIDERDGKPLSQKLDSCTKQSIDFLCADAIDDEPYVSSQLNPLLHCRTEIVTALNWLADAVEAQHRFIAV